MSLRASFEKHRLLVGLQRREELLAWCRQSLHGTAGAIWLKNSLLPLAQPRSVTLPNRKRRSHTILQRASDSILNVIFSRDFSKSQAEYFHDNFAVLNEKSGVGSENAGTIDDGVSFGLSEIVGDDDANFNVVDDNKESSHPAERSTAQPMSVESLQENEYLTGLLLIDEGERIAQELACSKSESTKVSVLKDLALYISSRQFSDTALKLLVSKINVVEKNNQFQSIVTRLFQWITVICLEHDKTSQLSILRTSKHFRYPSISNAVVKYWNLHHKMLPQGFLRNYVSCIQSRDFRAHFYDTLLKDCLARKDHLDAFQQWTQMCLQEYGHLNVHETGYSSTVMRQFRMVLWMIPQNSNPVKVVQFSKSLLLDKTHLGDFLSTLIFNYLKEGLYKKAIPVIEFKLANDLELSALDLNTGLEAYHLLDQDKAALKLYQQCPHLHNTVNSTIMIQVLASTQNFELLQAMFEKMQSEGIPPSDIQYGVVMNALGKRGDLKTVELLFSQFLKTKRKPTPAMLASLMKAAIMSKNYNRAFEFFAYYNRFKVPQDVGSCYYLLDSLSHLDDLTTPVALLNQLRSSGQTLEPRLVIPYLKTLMRLGDYRGVQNAIELYVKDWMKVEPSLEVMVVYLRALKVAKKNDELLKQLAVVEGMYGTVHSTQFYNLRLEVALELGEIDEFNDVYKRMSKRKVRFNHMTSELVLQFIGRTEANINSIYTSLDTFRQDPNVPPINASHYAALMKGLLQAEKYSFVLELYKTMQADKIPGNMQVYAYVINALDAGRGLNVQDMKTAKRILEVALNPASDSGKNPPISLIRPVVHQLSRFGDFRVAEHFLDMFSKKLTVNSMSKLRVLELYCHVHGASENWKAFASSYNAYVDGYSGMIGALGSEHVKKTGLFIRSAINPIWMHRVHERIASGKPTELIPELYSLMKSGFLITNENINETVKLLYDRDETLMDAIAFTDKFLAEGFIRVQSQRKLKRKGIVPQSPSQVALRLTRLNFNHMIRCVDDHLCKHYPNRNDREAETSRLVSRYRILKYFRERREWQPPSAYWKPLKTLGYERYLEGDVSN
ncbi:unnamed protein product [Kuraishia capsulata CBS 1993]|uniref:Mitochondrial 15S rRNA processing factor CCM1 n=1 Tax=Kuraishia capsulata CBS 1993 TaxID=1382522 RepID=W6MHM7_9ASCO|nr:uncharacterized protein KUCA_T00001764001 [Kuraishia capsulata CBS 1993]CDK25794.1 unnamed protein product [Kuraishia capsulata CBS 1993]